MKKATALYLLSILIGGGMPPLYGVVLMHVWIDLGWGMDVAKWLVSTGHPWLVSTWGTIWMTFPYYVMAIVVGVVACRLSKRLWFQLAGTAALTFFLAPYLYIYALGMNRNWFFFSQINTIRIMSLSALAIPIILLTAWLFHKRIRPLPPATDQVTIPEDQVSQ